MSKLDTNIRVMNLPICPNYRIICKNKVSSKNSSKSSEVIITYITEEEENYIDNLQDKVLKLNRGNRTFSIRLRQIYCYGEVDFNDIKDLNTIDNFSFIDNNSMSGLRIPSNYNYDKHECYSDIKYYKITETFSPAEAVKYAHGILNKPKRIILFKQ